MVALIDGMFVALSQPSGWIWSFAALIATWALAVLLWRSSSTRANLLLFAAVVGGIGLTVLLAVPFAISAMRAQDPAGPHTVRTAAITLSEAGKNNSAGPVGMHLWYPADDKPGPDAPVSDCAGLLSLPLAADDNARRLILYMPHLAGPADDNSARLAYLASRGYVIVAFDDIALDPASSDATPEDEAIRFERGEFRTQGEFDAGVARFNMRVRRQAEKALRGLDLLTACAAGAKNSVWTSSVDYSHVGFLGFSFGGATAAEASALDARVAAVANLDGNLFGQAFAGGVRAPYLFVMSGRSFGTTELMNQDDALERYHWRTWSRDLHEQKRLIARAGSLGIRIRDSVHLSLCNVVFEPHASRLWVLKNPIDFYNAVNLYTRSFFDVRLRGSGGPDATAPIAGITQDRFKFVERLGPDSPWPPMQGPDGAPLP